MKFLLALIGALVALCGGALLLAGPASAHATVVGSTPTDGQRLPAVPRSVTITFDESVGIGGLSYLHVTDPAGRRVETGPATHPGGAGRKVSVTLRTGLGDGTYTESYRVVSADSHPIAGVVRFVVGDGPLTVTAVDTGTSDHGVAVAFDAARWLSWAGFALLGGGWLLFTVWPAGRDDLRARRIVWTGWGVVGLGAVLELLLQGAYAAGESLPSTFDPTLIDATLHSDYGQLHSARLLLLGLLAVVLGLGLQPGRARRGLDDAFWPLGLGLGYTFAAVGHATTTRPAWLSISGDLLHLSAMAVWVGGLVLVVATLLPRRDADELSAVLPVFSRVAFTAVIVIAVTGTYAAWRGVGSWRALLDTEYGLLVLAKVAGFCGLLALGDLSRRLIQHRVRRPVVAYAMTADPVVPAPPELDEISAEQMRRSVLVEVVLAAAVLAFTSVLVSQPRGPEALVQHDHHESATSTASATAQLGGGRTATVTIDPAQHGTVGVRVALSPGPSSMSVTGTATEPDKQLGPIPLKLVADGPDRYAAAGVDLPIAGRWVIALVVTYSQFSAITTDVTITLK